MLLAVAETVVARVDLGYFDNFKSAGTLLIEADDEGLQHLGASLRSLQQGSVGSLAIEALPCVTAHHGVRLTAARGFRESVTRCGTASNEFPLAAHRARLAGRRRKDRSAHRLPRRAPILRGTSDRSPSFRESTVQTGGVGTANCAL